MPKSDDISALYDQFSGNANSFREIGRTARAVEASSRWPLFSQMAQERGSLVPSTGDLTPSAPTQRHQGEPPAQLTPPDSEPPLPPAGLQRASKLVVPNSRDTAHAPSVWNIGRRPTTEPTPTPAPATVPPSASWPIPSATLAEVAKPNAVKRAIGWLRAPAVQPAAAPSPKSASPSEFLSAAASQTQSRPPAPAFPVVPQGSSQVGTSPLRRLVRADPSAPHSGVSNDAPLAEDLTSVFSRLACRPNRERER
jgi:hypothetical protein